MCRLTLCLSICSLPSPPGLHFPYASSQFSQQSLSAPKDSLELAATHVYAQPRVQKSQSVPNACRPAIHPPISILFRPGQFSPIRTCSTSSHYIVITLQVGSDEDDLGPEAVPGLLQELHGIRTASALLRVPEDPPLRLDVFVYQAHNRRPIGPLQVRANPYQEPWRIISMGMALGGFLVRLPVGALDTG
jgi:hypothetical protein